jgi:hypothetical protein
MPFPIQTSVNDIPMIYPRVNRIQEIKWHKNMSS